MTGRILLLSVIILATIWCYGIAGEKQEIRKTFEAKESIRIRTILGDCKVQKSEDDKIHVLVEYSYDPYIFEADMKENERTLTLRERFHEDNPRGRALWTVSVPGETDIQFDSGTGSVDIVGVPGIFEAETGTGEVSTQNSDGQFELESGTGDIIVKNCKGEFELSSGTGSVEIEDTQGEFEASSGTGDVEAYHVELEEESEFSSGTGDAIVHLSKEAGQDMTVSSGTGDAVVNVSENALKGFFEFTARADDGRIICPVAFDKEEEFWKGDDLYERKSFTKGDNDSRIRIKTGTGKAQLKLK
jgi:hypothetical protein